VDATTESGSDADDAADASSADAGDSRGDTAVDGASEAGRVDGADASGDVAAGDDAADATSNDARDAAPDVSGPDASDAAICTNDLSNIGAADFRIAFTITTRATALSALLNQRPVCNHGDFWDVRLSPDGTLAVETDDGTHYTPLFSTLSVNDGNPHNVMVSRVSGTLSIVIDGSGAGSAASTSSFGSLAALRSGTDVCDGLDPTVVLVGMVSNVCISSP
jgi:hypothetical protein